MWGRTEVAVDERRRKQVVTCVIDRG